MPEFIQPSKRDSNPPADLSELLAAAETLCCRPWLSEVEDHAIRRSIVDRSLPLLIRSYAQTTVKDIADAVGLQAPSLYNHFSSKEAILIAAIESVQVDALRAVVLGPMSSSVLHPDERLAAFIRSFVEWQLGRPISTDLTSFLYRLEQIEIDWKEGTRIAEIFARRRLLVRVARWLIDQAAPHDELPTRFTAFAMLELCVSTPRYQRLGVRNTEVSDQMLELMGRILRRPLLRNVYKPATGSGQAMGAESAEPGDSAT